MDAASLVLSTACSDGLDNDGDGLTDLDDPGCFNDATGLTELFGTVCDDGVDNDGDLAIDLADPGCDDVFDDSERLDTACDDGIDNDGDGFVDLNDPSCLGDITRTVEALDTECDDGLDNDGDSLVDLLDPSCLGDASRTTELLGTPCDDTVDNDGDGMVDLADPGCFRDVTQTDEAGEFVVNSDLDKVDASPGDGLCQTNVAQECTLRAAVMEANESAGTQGVRLPDGFYALSIISFPFLPDTDAVGDLDLLDDIVLVGAGADRTTIYGVLDSRVLDVPYPTRVLIADVAISGGNIGRNYEGWPPLEGAGIRNEGELRLLRSEVFGNFINDQGNANADYYDGIEFLGGGIFNSGELELIETTVHQNVIFVFGNLSRFYLSFVAGAGIANVRGRYPDGKGLELINSTVSENALYIVGAQPDAALVAGAGIYSESEASMSFSTVASNGAQGTEPDGLNIYGFVSARSSIVAADETTTEPNCGFLIDSLGHNLSDDSSCFPTDPAVGDQADTDALLGVFGDNGGSTRNYLPLPGSPAIDAIAPEDCDLAFDQRGFPRGEDGDDPPDGEAGCDVGSVEVPEPDLAISLALGAVALALLSISARNWKSSSNLTRMKRFTPSTRTSTPRMKSTRYQPHPNSAENAHGSTWSAGSA